MPPADLSPGWSPKAGPGWWWVTWGRGYPVLRQAETHHAVRVLVNTVNHSHARTAIHADHRSNTHGNQIPERLTKNQMLGDRTSSRSKVENDKDPGLHQSLHQRLRTTVSTLGPDPEEGARSRTTCR